MLNIKFGYLYRDAGNYKKWAEVVFSNPDRLTAESIMKTLRDAFLQDGVFIARQIRVPEAFLYTLGDASSDDHCFHEFDAVETTAEAPSDRFLRSISQFVAEVSAQAKQGWSAFDPHERKREHVPN
jgi:hypothetical protein